MAYVGNNLTIQQYAPQIAYFNGNGSTVAFTLPTAVVSAAQIIVVIENVIQNPSSSYSVSGTTLTFTSAPPSGTNNIWVEYTSLQTNTVVPSAGTVGQAQMSSPTGTGFPVLQTSPTLITPTISTGAGSATFPSATGTVMVSGNMPAFSAYANAAQTVSSNVFTKVVLQVEDFDTNNNFDNTTNYRFTPTVAGYYQINASLRLNGTVTTTQLSFQIYKNGSSFAGLVDINPSASLSANGLVQIGNSILIYMNGSTDYLEIYGYYYLGTSTFSANTPYTSRFSGSLVRAA
jgi:hypothetical protein